MDTPTTMSEAIVNAPTIVLAGAGASKHLGYPVAKKFLEHLDRTVTTVFDQDPPALKVWESTKECQDSDDADSTDLNFEDIYDRLEAAIDSEWLYKDQPLPEGGGPYTPPPREAAKHLRDLIGEEIVSIFGTPPEFKVLASSQCWTYLIAAVHPGSRQVLPIFTTNYDVALETLFDHLPEQAGFRMVDAFKRRVSGAHPWQAYRYQSFSPTDPSLRYVWLSHLHGCAAWHKPDDLGLDQADDIAPVYYYTTPDGSQSTQWPPAIIPPSRKKNLSEDPYGTEYRYFQRCLENTSMLVIIGHGLADPHLAHACVEALRVNRELRIVVLSLDASNTVYQQRLSVDRLNEDRVAFIKLPFDRSTMSKFQISKGNHEPDIEAALRAVAWCTDNTPKLLVHFGSAWAAIPADHANMWSHGTWASEIVYNPAPMAKGLSFYGTTLRPLHSLEGVITIEVATEESTKWGGIRVGSHPNSASSAHVAIVNEGGSIKVKDSSLPSAKDLIELAPERPGQLVRRVWFRVTQGHVAIASVTAGGTVKAAVSVQTGLIGPLHWIALVGATDSRCPLKFRNLELPADS